MIFFCPCKDIAYDYCPIDVTGFAPDNIRPDYKAECREVATGVCEGSVKKQVNKNGCGISSEDLLELQGKCERQVNRMTGGFTDTPRPTPRPTSR